MIPLQPDGYRGSDGCGGGDGDNDGQDSCIEMQRFVGSQEGKQRQTRAVAYLHNDDDDSSRDINHKFELEDGGAGFRVGVDDGERARKVWQHGTLRGLKKEKMKKRRILTRPRDGTRGRSHRWCACRPCCDAYIRFRDWFRYPRVTLVVGSAVVFAVMVMFMVLSATVLVEKTQVPLDSQVYSHILFVPLFCLLFCLCLRLVSLSLPFLYLCVCICIYICLSMCVSVYLCVCLYFVATCALTYTNT